MAFDDLLRTITLSMTKLALDGSQRWKDARAKAEAGNYSPSNAIADVMTTWASALDMWAAPFGQASAASSNLVVIAGLAGGVPASGYGPGGSTSLVSAP